MQKSGMALIRLTLTMHYLRRKNYCLYLPFVIIAVLIKWTIYLLLYSLSMIYHLNSHIFPETRYGSNAQIDISFSNISKLFRKQEKVIPFSSWKNLDTYCNFYKFHVLKIKNGFRNRWKNKDFRLTATENQVKNINFFIEKKE